MKRVLLGLFAIALPGSLLAQTSTVVVVPPSAPAVSNPFGDLVQNIIRIKQLQIDQQRADTERDAVRAATQPKAPAKLSASQPLYSETTTLGMLNGRAWRNFAALKDTKLLFVAAYMNGWEINRMVGARDSAGVDGHADELRGPRTYQEVIDTLDAIYSVPENLSVPIGWAMMAGAAVERGEIGKSEVIRAMRAQVSKALDGYTGPDNSPQAVIESALAKR